MKKKPSCPSQARARTWMAFSSPSWTRFKIIFVLVYLAFSSTRVLLIWKAGVIQALKEIRQ